MRIDPVDLAALAGIAAGLWLGYTIGRWLEFEAWSRLAERFRR